MSLAAFVICIPLDKTEPNDQSNEGAAAEIKPALAGGHAEATNGDSEKLAANANVNKHLQKRETSPPEKEEAKSAPPTTTPAPADEKKERKTRDTANKSTAHKKSERPKRQLNENREYSTNSQQQLGQQASQLPGQQSQAQGQLGQLAQQQNEARREQNSFQQRRPSRSAFDGEQTAKDAEKQ